MFDVCHVMYDMAMVNLAELPSKTGVGAPAPRGPAPCYPSYTIAPQQVEDCEDTLSDSNESVRVVCIFLLDGA